MIEEQHSRVHVLLDLPAEEAARHVLLALTCEGIPRELLRIEHRVAPPLRPPHRFAPYFALAAALVCAAVGALLISSDRVYGAVVCALYAGVAGLLLGVAFDAWRWARYKRRRAARERSGYEIVCPEDVLVQSENY